MRAEEALSLPLMNRSGKSGGSKPRRWPGVPSTSISRSKRCSFCNFFENGTNPARMEAYVTTLCGEIKRRADSPLAQRRPFGAVYLGGGIPTDMTADQRERVLEALRRLPRCRGDPGGAPQRL